MSGPDRIYLQDAGDYASAVEFEVTWCAEKQDDHDTEYIRRDPAVLAAIPEVQAILADAVMAEREACLSIIGQYCDDEILKPASGWPDEEVRDWNNGGADHLIAVAAAIRKRGEG